MKRVKVLCMNVIVCWKRCDVVLENDNEVDSVELNEWKRMIREWNKDNIMWIVSISCSLVKNHCIIQIITLSLSSQYSSSTNLTSIIIIHCTLIYSTILINSITYTFYSLTVYRINTIHTSYTSNTVTQFISIIP